MILEFPWALALLVLVPVVLLAGRGSARRAALGYPATRALAALAPSRRARLARALPWLRALALSLCALALADPRLGLEAARIERQGIAIALVLDTSSSMEAEDLALGDEPANRLEVAKGALRSFVAGAGGEGRGRAGDAIALVAFARFADAFSPLTLDHRALLASLDEIRVVPLPEEDGTALGDAMVLASDLLRRADADSRVMILLTDGNHNAGDVEPLDAAHVAKTFGIRIYAIGAGSTGLAPASAPTGAAPLPAAPVFSDDDLLRQVAEVTGGRAFRATDGEALMRVTAEIDRLETSTNTADHYQRRVPVFPALLLAALALLTLEAGLANTVLRTAP